MKTLLSTDHLPKEGLGLDREAADRLGEEVCLINAHLSAGRHAELTRLRLFEESKLGWEGWSSVAQWLSYASGLCPGTAREHVRVAKALKQLPLIDEALRRGELSFSKVRAITRVANPANEKVLLEQAKYATGGQLEYLVRKFRQGIAAEKRGPGPHDSNRGVWESWREDGLVKLTAVVRPEEAVVFKKSMDAATALAFRRRRRSTATPEALEGIGGRLAPKNYIEGPSPEVDYASGQPVPDHPAGADEVERMAPHPSVSAEASRKGRFTRADAFVAVAEAFLSTQSIRSQIPGRYEVALHVTPGALRNQRGPEERCELEDGTPVHTKTARRLACDSAVTMVEEDESGSILNLGRRSRTVSAPLRKALMWRDGCCKFPGCTNRIFLEFHHLTHWADGGETKPENLIGLCRFHHRLVHEGGWKIEVQPDTTAVFIRPDGRRFDGRPPHPQIDPFITEGMIEVQEDMGLELTPRTLWAQDGYPMDREFAVSCLWPYVVEAA